MIIAGRFVFLVWTFVFGLTELIPPNMPLISRKEFAELCGDLYEATNKYIIRGKIDVLPDNKKLIDTDNAVNAAFIQERQLFNRTKALGDKLSHAVIAKNKQVAKLLQPVTKKSKKVTNPPAEKEVKLSAKPPDKIKIIAKPVKESKAKAPEPKISPAEIRQKERILAEQNTQARARMDQDMQKKQLEIENLELSRQQKLLLLSKSAGNLMPVDLVKGVLKRQASAIINNFEKDIETQVGIMVNVMAGGDPRLHVRFIGEIKELLSRGISRAGKQADEEIIILVDDYSQTLVRGQKKV